jgi:hypothetical protein
VLPSWIRRNALKYVFSAKVLTDIVLGNSIRGTIYGVRAMSIPV